MYILHVTCCRLQKQERQRGIPVREYELWVERLMQAVKRPITKRITGNPEKLFVRIYLLEIAAASIRVAHPYWDTMASILGTKIRQGKNLDAGGLVRSPIW